MNVDHQIVGEGIAKDLLDHCLFSPWLDSSSHWLAVNVYGCLRIYRSKALPSLQNQFRVNGVPFLVVTVIILPLKFFEQVEIVRNLEAWVSLSFVLVADAKLFVYFLSRGGLCLTRDLSRL